MTTSLQSDTAPDTPATDGSSAEALKQLGQDVRSAGHAMKRQASETKDAVVQTAKVVASDTKDLARAGYKDARTKFRETSERTSAAMQDHLDEARAKVRANPLPSVACALGIGYLLGRFIFNGR